MTRASTPGGTGPATTTEDNESMSKAEPGAGAATPSTTDPDTTGPNTTGRDTTDVGGTDADATEQSDTAAAAAVGDRSVGKVRSTVAAVVVLALVAALVFLLLKWQSQRHIDGLRDEAAAAAGRQTEALLSYTAATIDDDLSAAREGLTGDFLSYYQQFGDQVLAPAAKERGITTQADAVATGVVSVDDDEAVVLLFIDQTTTTAANPEPSQSVSRVRVTLDHVDERWLVSGLDPL